MKREDAAISKTRTVRFQSIVEACGKPEMVVLWTAPEKDSHFHSAVKQQRIMTVLQPAVGTQKDFGVIGFQPQKNASYLKFPKSLERFANARIVGINYDLIQTPKAVSRVLPEVKPSGRLSPANSAFPTGGRLAHEFPAEPPHPVPRSHRAGREPRPAAPPRPKLK